MVSCILPSLHGRLLQCLDLLRLGIKMRSKVRYICLWQVLHIDLLRYIRLYTDFGLPIIHWCKEKTVRINLFRDFQHRFPAATSAISCKCLQDAELWPRCTMMSGSTSEGQALTNQIHLIDSVTIFSTPWTVNPKCYAKFRTSILFSLANNVHQA